MSFARTYYYRVLPMALLMVFITACSSGDDFSDTTDTEESGTPITFSCAEKEITRADNSTVLSDYIRDFMVYGIKKKSANETVFSDYIVWYSTDASTTNKSNWEYKGTFTGCPGGDDSKKWSDWTNYYDPMFNEELGGSQQMIKYWDYSADHYLFWAIGKTDKLYSSTSEYSYETNEDMVTIDDGEIKSIEFDETLETVSDDNNCLYYTAPVYVANTSGYGQPVELKFNQFRSKIRVGFYEDLKYNSASDAAASRRYQVKDLKFYQPDTENSDFSTNTGENVYIKGNFLQEAIVTLSYDNSSTPDVAVSVDPVTDTEFQDMGKIALSGALPSSSASPQWTKDDGVYTVVMPNTNEGNKWATGPLTIMCTYTVVDTETGEEKEEDKLLSRVQAVVPAEYTKWEPNHSYTYLFKITDMNKITLTDVQVQDWGEGASTNQIWHNW